MSVLSSRPIVRWGVPLGAAVLVLGIGAVVTTLRAVSNVNLPTRTAAELLVDVQTARLDGLSGTVIQTADLGLPTLPLPADSAGLASLITGSHTLRVWYSGPDKARVALLGTLGETDIIRNGRDVWTWSSNDKSASHKVLPPGAAAVDLANPLSALPVSPQEAADRLLAAIEPSTAVTTAGTGKVAGRAAYELVLAPRDAASLVSQVRLAIDGEHRVPLRIRVYAKGHLTPAFEVGFKSVDFNRPGDEHFVFTPPPGTTINEEGSANEGGDAQQVPPDAKRQPPVDPGRLPIPVPGQPAKPGPVEGPEAMHGPKLIGTGWTTVLVARVSDGPLDAAASGDNPLAAILGSLPTVNGSWGSGRVLKSRLFSALLTDDGRILVGAVTAERLAEVAGDPAAALR